MTDRPADHELPDERSWLDLEPGSVSSDFVDRTLQRVLADRDDPRTEPFPAGFLEAYEAPEASPDFVDRVAAAAAAQRIGDKDMQEVLRSYEVPEPSSDFVARTLIALRSERKTPRAGRRRVGSLLPVGLVAAAVLVAWLLIAPRSGPPAGDLRPALHATWQPDQGPRYSPNPTATLFSRTLRRAEPDALPVVVPDRLLAMAQEGDE